ncbi:uncharacterized protein LOC128230703 [Mya arenaria]|uniref:uncharacterized protein LOC128230703 n=1 Tax=Mya arenaria TaxID=6604 RepID=UPI0022E64BC2|nr:uncharacterized protein LOC128230703 [Mya arenaria]
MSVTSIEEQIRNSKHVEFVTIKTLSNPATDEEYSPDLEDPAIASQVQYPFADTTLIARFWRSLPALKWVHTQRNGVDLVIDSLKKNEAPPFILTKTPGDLNSSFIIEYVLGYIIAMNRKIFEARESQSRKDWQQRPLLCNQNIAECTVGILGVGENTSLKPVRFWDCMSGE